MSDKTLKVRIMENMAIVSMTSKDVRMARVIASRIGDSFLTGVLVAQVAELKKRMMNSVVCFEFCKKNGEVTRRWGTTSPSLAIATTTGTGLSGDDRKVVTFFDVRKAAWRSFQPQSLIRIVD